jgi:hypothetical protein
VGIIGDQVGCAASHLARMDTMNRGVISLIIGVLVIIVLVLVIMQLT